MNVNTPADMGSWQTATAWQHSTCELKSILCNLDAKDLVAPLRAVSRQPDNNFAALELQEQWEHWLSQRESLTEDIRRGRECLSQARREIKELRARLESWTEFERVCGHNPIPECTQALGANERIEKFIPGWLRRRQHHLRSVNRAIKALCGKKRA